MADNYDEINEPFKRQAQHVFVETSSQSDEPSANFDNYISFNKNKNVLQYSRCFSRRKLKFLIISSIENNVEAQIK